MKHFGLLAGLILAQTAGAATVQHYINTAPIDTIRPPNISAVSFENRSVFNVNTLSSASTGGGSSGGTASFLLAQPYETFNTLNFTNTASGRMRGEPGFWFNHSFNGGRERLANFSNKGFISALAWMLVDATNIVNSGLGLGVGARGVIRIDGDTVNLSRSSLYSGVQYGFPFSQGFGTNFVSGYPPSYNSFSEPSIVDFYWGVGSNRVAGAQLTGPLIGNPPSTRGHSVTNVFDSGFNGIIIRNVSLPLLTPDPTSYVTYAYTNRITNPAQNTNNIHIVFVPTNINSGVNIDVRFRPHFVLGQSMNGGTVPIVRFSVDSYDPIFQSTNSDAFYVEDYAGFQTNFFVSANLSSAAAPQNQTQRPNTYWVSRSPRFGLGFDFLNTSNAVFVPDYLSNANYLSNDVDVVETGYSGGLVVGTRLYQSSIFGTRPGHPLWGGFPINDISNYAGRVEIFAKKLNLDTVRIRSESSLIVKADELVGNKLPIVDAGVLSYDLKSTQPSLLFSNMIPRQTSRFLGEIALYSAMWRNATTNGGETNIYQIHVLFVDHNLTLTQQVVLQDLKLRATNVVVADRANIFRNFLIDATDLTVSSTGFLTNGVAFDVGASNLIGVLNFTNNGTILFNRDVRLGTDRSTPYENIVNNGTLEAGALYANTKRFVNTSNLLTYNSSADIRADDLVFEGPTNIVTTFGDLALHGKRLYATNSIFNVGSAGTGGLILDLSESITDAGVSSSNVWTVGAGFSINQVPRSNDLSGTTIVSIAQPLTEVFHYSEAQDMGVSSDGYVNNMSIGRLVLDGGDFSLFRFSPGGTGTNRAVYVDYLQLNNYATNYDDAIAIDDGVTVYFANSNIDPRRLNHRFNEKLRWVSTFAGPLSSTNVVYPSTASYPLNLALVTAADLDSDSDGIANVNDPTPIWIPAESANLVISTVNLPPVRPLISWNALLSYDDGTFRNVVTNIVEYSSAVMAGDWNVLTNLVAPFGPPQFILTNVVDFSGSNRFYRVRVHVEDP